MLRKTYCRILLLWLLAFGLAFMALGASPVVPARKKLIELGWDIPDTGYLRQHCKEMEETTVFDGIIFQAKGKSDEGQEVNSLRIWDKAPWKKEWLRQALQDLRDSHLSQFTDNFIRLDATPGNLEWTDDAGWEALADKAALCAWLARKGGAKGLVIDFESYEARQFKYNGGPNFSFVREAVLARKRGAQFLKAVAGEYSDAVIFTLWLNSINDLAGRSEQPETVLVSSPYGLLPAFIDGMLDVMPSRMILVDGCEGGYRLEGKEGYLAAASQMRGWNGSAMRLVSPENRAKYRQQVQAGFGFYLDMFVNNEGSPFYRGPLEGSRMKHLRRNLDAACEAADEYVWIYGEQCCWWKPSTNWGKTGAVAKSVGKGRYWQETLPELDLAMAWARDPIDGAAREMEWRGKQKLLTNSIVNGDFGDSVQVGNARRPAGFGTWQEATSHGVFDWDAQVGTGSGRAIHVQHGCFLQKVPVKPGDRYAARAKARIRGCGVPLLSIRWQTADGKWADESLDRSFAFREGAGEWQEAFGGAEVPLGASQLVVCLNIAEQRSEGDVCWFDDLQVLRLGGGE